MLVAAIDESSDGTNYGPDYWTFLVGEEFIVNRNFRLLPPSFTHMRSSMATKREKLELLNKFDFSGNILIYCVKFDFKRLRKEIDTKYKIKNLRKSKVNHARNIAKEIYFVIRMLYEDFVLHNNMHIEDLIFEIDNDEVQNYLRTANVRTTRNIGNAHCLADCVAHANVKKWTVRNIKECNEEFTRDFHTRAINRIIRP